MLYAELHGKLSADIGDDAERREDVLTSTVLGTLFTAGAWDVLVEWLSRARRGAQRLPSLEVPASSACQYWFWPWLDNAEPDVVVQLGSTLVLIEAKYLSSKSSSSTLAGSERSSSDQLVREWRAISSSATSAGYEARLRELVVSAETSRILIYLVRRSRYAREAGALEHSLAQVPDAQMYLLTWEDLDEVLATRLHLRWADELQRYLHRRGLAAFRGYHRAFRALPSRALQAWRQRSPIRPTFATTLPWQPAIAHLARRQSRFSQLRGWRRAFHPEAADLLHGLASRPSRFPQE